MIRIRDRTTSVFLPVGDGHGDRGIRLHAGPSDVAAAGLILAAWLVAVGCRGYGSQRVVTGFDYIAIGLVFFSLAVLTSMAKGGALPRRILDHKETIREARE